MYASIQVYKYTTIQLYNYASMQVYKYVYIYIHIHTYMYIICVCYIYTHFWLWAPERLSNISKSIAGRNACWRRTCQKYEMFASFGQVFIKLWMRDSNRKYPSLFSTWRVVPLQPVMVSLPEKGPKKVPALKLPIWHIKRLKTIAGLGTLLHGQRKHRSPRHGHPHRRSGAPQTQAKTGKDRQR